MSQGKKTIAIVESDCLLRELLCRRIGSLGGFAVVVDHDNGRDALSMIVDRRPEILIAAVILSHLNGIALVESVRKQYPIKAVIVSDHSYHLHRAIQAGAAAYLLKRGGIDELERALYCVAAGGSFIAPGVRDALLHDSHGGNPDDKLALLTPRQKQILQLIAEGNSNKEIAHALCIETKTVDHHRTALIRRLDLHTAADLTRFAIEVDLVRIRRFQVSVGVDETQPISSVTQPN